VLQVDGGFALAVLPAHHRVNLTKLAPLIPAATVQLASEEMIAKLFPDCEVGAVPPLGHLYNHMPVYLSNAIPQDDTITFNAGTHDCAIQMPFEDFEKIAQPRVMSFSE
jgi:Ala-tRNA(Pro) deacylase